MRAEKDAGSTRWVETKAVLLSDNNGPVWKIGNEIVTGMGADSYRFPDLPENLYSRPTLVWMLENRGGESQRVEASYLTSNMRTGAADYVLTVGRDENGADLDGWVTLVNNSGVAYSNAKLQLVAGQLNRVEPPIARAKAYAGALETNAAAPPQFGQESFSEYHLYTLGRRTSIQNNESKQISLLAGSGVPVEKYLLVEGQQYWFRNPQGIGNPISQPVKVLYRLKNDEKEQPRYALPARRNRPVSIKPIRKAASSSSARTTSTTPPKTKRSRFTSVTLSTWSASAKKPTTRRSRATPSSSNTKSRCAITKTVR